MDELRLRQKRQGNHGLYVHCTLASPIDFADPTYNERLRDKGDFAEAWSSTDSNGK